MGAMSRTKGARGETSLVKLLHTHGWPHAQRRRGSGIHGGGDIADGPAGVSIECKCVERLNLAVAYAQAVHGARPTDIPVVAHKRNNGVWMATLELGELLPLLQLRERG